jgi:hypothetical protein
MSDVVVWFVVVPVALCAGLAFLPKGGPAVAGLTLAMAAVIWGMTTQWARGDIFRDLVFAVLLGSVGIGGLIQGARGTRVSAFMGIGCLIAAIVVGMS